MKWRYLFLHGNGKPIHNNLDFMHASSVEAWRRNPWPGRVVVDLPGLFILDLGRAKLQVFISEEYIDG